MEQATGQPWWAAVLIAAIVALAGAVVVLWRWSDKRDRRREATEKEHVAERALWEARAEKLRAEYEEKHREIVEQYARDLEALRDGYASEVESIRDQYRDREDAIRKEYAEQMESVEAEATKTQDAMYRLLEKIYERFIGPRGHY